MHGHRGSALKGTKGKMMFIWNLWGSGCIQERKKDTFVGAVNLPYTLQLYGQSLRFVYNDINHPVQNP
jgi:hypothetical protein